MIIFAPERALLCGDTIFWMVRGCLFFSAQAIILLAALSVNVPAAAGFFVSGINSSSIHSRSVPNIATVFNSLRIVVCPVNETAQVVPLVHAPDMHAITHPDRNALGQVDIVSDEQGCAVADIDNEALVARTIVVVRQQPRHEALNLDPGSRITFIEPNTQATPLLLFIVRPGVDTYRVP
jgi:hypothetical protein